MYRDKLHEPKVLERFQQILDKARQNKSKDKPDQELDEYEKVSTSFNDLAYYMSLTLDLSFFKTTRREARRRTLSRIVWLRGARRKLRSPPRVSFLCFPCEGLPTDCVFRSG